MSVFRKSGSGFAIPKSCQSETDPIADIGEGRHSSDMRWGLFAISCSLLAVPMLAFPSPSSPAAIGLFSLGLLLLMDWSYEQSLGYAAWGMETRKDEIVEDFYDFENAKWRYVLAFLVSGALAASFAFTSSEKIQATFLIGGFALYGAASFAGALRSRRRVVRGK